MLVPFLMTLGVGNAYALHRCNGDLIARPTCCCPEMEESTPPAPGAAVSEPCCCSIETAPVARVESRAQTNGFASVKTFAGPIAFVPHVADPSAARAMAHVGLRPPLSPKPPTLLLLKTSFLI